MGAVLQVEMWSTSKIVLRTWEREGSEGRGKGLGFNGGGGGGGL